MTVPGVGPVGSLADVSTIDIPSRFRHSRAVGAVLGLTPVLNLSGESKRIGHVLPMRRCHDASCTRRRRRC
jgi:transposase